MMFNKFMRNYGFYVISIGLAIIIFACGYAVGKHGIKSAASLEQAENYNRQTQETTTEKTESETVLVDLGEFEITAYCTCSECCGKSDGITATGAKATAGQTVAVDPNVIPYGTEIIINSHTYTAEDTGGAIKGNKIDICVATHEAALNYGVQYANVYVAR